MGSVGFAVQRDPERTSQPRGRPLGVSLVGPDVAVVSVPRRSPDNVQNHDEIRFPDPQALEAQQRALTRGVLSLICTTTGRRPTPDERGRLAALTQEIDRVRQHRRDAVRQRA